MTPQPDPDGDHLKILSICHYVVGGLMTLCACAPVFHFGIGLFMLFAPAKADDALAQRFAGGFFALFAGAVILAGWALAGSVIVAGRFLSQRRRYNFCLVVAVFEAAACSPLGTVLGVFTIFVLMRPSVKALFGQAHAALV
jgi:hypothetical protein